MNKRKIERREEALERNKVREERSPSDQLRELDRRLGKGTGAKRERAKLGEISG